MRIVLLADVSPVNVLGGGERVLGEHAVRLARRGHQVVVLCRAPSNGAPARVEMEGVDVRHVPAHRARPWDWVLGAAWRAGKMIDTLPADVVVAYQPIVSYGALTRSRHSPFPLVYVFLSPAAEEYRSRHTNGWAASRWLHALEARVLEQAERIVVLSAFSRRQLLSHHSVEEHRIVEIPGGVDTNLFRPAEDRSLLRERLARTLLEDHDPQGTLLLTVRNLVPRMGLEDLIRAMPAVLSEFPETTLLIVGDGPLRGTLEKMVASSGLRAHVRFLGYVEEEYLPDLMRAADLFLLPTRLLEGFGLVTVESLACGTPVLGTPVGATPEILEPLDADLLLSSTGAAAIAEGITKLLRRASTDPGSVVRLQKAARVHAETYDWELSIDALEQLLRETADVPRCPICESRSFGFELRLRNETVLRCRECGSFRRHPTPSPQVLASFYRNDYGGWFLAQADDPGRRALFAHLLRDLGPAEGRRLLDLGAGSGLLVRMARDAGWKAEGTELSHRSRAWAEEVHGVSLGDPEKKRPDENAYDVVTLINVLDQAPNPGALLDEAHRALRPGGRLLLRVPNASFHVGWLRWVTRWKLRRWQRLAVLHAHGLTPRGLERWLPLHGFENVRVRAGKIAKGPAGGHMMVWLCQGVLKLGRLLSLVSGARIASPSLEAQATKRAG